MRTAFSSIAANTGSRSPGELEITWSTSDVAVCCSNASVRAGCAGEVSGALTQFVEQTARSRWR